MKFAVLSDIHANPIALDAVLTDIRKQGDLDGYLVLGDLVAQGYDPIAVAERLASLPNAHFVRGNTDRYVAGRQLPHWLDIDRVEPERLDLVRAHAWTTGCLATAGWLVWIQSLPLEYRFELPDGSRVLCVHAAPGTDFGAGITPAQTDEELNDVLEGCDAELVLVGHTHWPLDRQVGKVRVVNPGSVSYPWPPDLRASYALIEGDASGYTVRHCRVAFDIDAVITAIRASGYYPDPEWIVQRYAGDRRPSWDLGR